MRPGAKFLFNKWLASCFPLLVSVCKHIGMSHIKVERPKQSEGRCSVQYRIPPEPVSLGNSKLPFATNGYQGVSEWPVGLHNCGFSN